MNHEIAVAIEVGVAVLVVVVVWVWVEVVVWVVVGVGAWSWRWRRRAQMKPALTISARIRAVEDQGGIEIAAVQTSALANELSELVRSFVERGGCETLEVVHMVRLVEALRTLAAETSRRASDVADRLRRAGSGRSGLPHGGVDR